MADHRGGGAVRGRGGSRGGRAFRGSRPRGNYSREDMGNDSRWDKSNGFRNGIEKRIQGVCFRCRKSGHTMQQCREIVSNESKEVQRRTEIMCFRCGSLAHSLSMCPVPAKFQSLAEVSAKATLSDEATDSNKTTRRLDSDEVNLLSEERRVEILPFATCFICQGVGHLSRHCKDNKNGVYPKGGGCRFCGSKWHYLKDCPEKLKSLPLFNGLEKTDRLEAWLEPAEPRKEVQPASVKKQKKEIIF